MEEKEGNLKLLKLNQSLQQTAHPGSLTSSLQGPLMSLAPRLMTLRGTNDFRKRGSQTDAAIEPCLKKLNGNVEITNLDFGL